MKRSRRVGGLLLALLSPGLAPAAELRELGWLAGCWGESDPATGAEIRECWMSPKGGLMPGMNRSLSAKGKAHFEFMRIAEQDGALVFYGQPGGKSAVAFPLKSLKPGEAVFHNPGHDFPQTILYRREGDRLRARVEGLVRGRLESEEWLWQAEKSWP